jgi:hypothetical protein
VLAISAAFAYYQQTQHLPPVDPIVSLKTQLHTQADQTAQQKIDSIKKDLGANPDANSLRAAAQQIQAIEMEKEATNFSVDHVVRHCPTGPQRDGDSKITLNISECDSGTPLWLSLINPWEEQSYVISLYKFGKDGKKIKVALAPVIKLTREHKPDGHSEAVRVSDENDVLNVVYKLRGDVTMVTQGDADYVELQLVKD